LNVTKSIELYTGWYVQWHFRIEVVKQPG